MVALIPQLVHSPSPSSCASGEREACKVTLRNTQEKYPSQHCSNLESACGSGFQFTKHLRIFQQTSAMDSDITFSCSMTLQLDNDTVIVNMMACGAVVSLQLPWIGKLSCFEILKVSYYYVCLTSRWWPTFHRKPSGNHQLHTFLEEALFRLASFFMRCSSLSAKGICHNIKKQSHTIHVWENISLHLP